MRCVRTLMAVAVVVAILAAPATGADDAAPSKPNALSRTQIEEGWIMLFDGETTFGWKTEGDAKIKDGTLLVGGEKAASATTTTEFGGFELQFQGNGAKGASVILNGKPFDLATPGPSGKDWTQYKVTVGTDGNVNVSAKRQEASSAKTTTGTGTSRTPVGFRSADGEILALRNVFLKPLGTKSLFNGKDLTGWKPVPGNPSKFSVTDKGELNIKDGGGEIQTEGQWADFVFQLDIISYGEHLNSGVFYRALPGQFWQGYEAQIRNEWKGYVKGKARDEKNEDRTKPVDYGTGGIYNRQPSRKVVSNDHEWFTMTLIVAGPRSATWVNGYQTADFVDTKPPAESARNGSRLGKGCISLQGHDPTTNLSFRNIRVAELPPPAEKKPAKAEESR
ncbi:MAG TPA: DUF1080 domain-containing protein [Phycisphaerae bacterium]|nr:DUF1080 domain-containing protein [Phycisphaerae bacterium]HRY66499.1 DUF1080 domain-containing protein [Phycisphaerae bacterium]